MRGQGARESCLARAIRAIPRACIDGRSRQTGKENGVASILYYGKGPWTNGAVVSGLVLLDGSRVRATHARTRVTRLHRDEDDRRRVPV